MSVEDVVKEMFGNPYPYVVVDVQYDGQYTTNMELFLGQKLTWRGLSFISQSPTKITIPNMGRRQIINDLCDKGMLREVR